LTDSGGDEGGVDSHGLPLERLVIGAEETITSAPLNNDGTPRGPSSCSSSLPSDRRINSVDEMPEEVTLMTAELSEVVSEIQQVKDKGECKLQCCSDDMCSNVPLQRTCSSMLMTSCNVENHKTEDQHEVVSRNGSPDVNEDPAVCSANCSDTNAHVSNDSMDSKCRDRYCSAFCGGDVKSNLVKHVCHNSLPGKNQRHSKQDKSYSDIDDAETVKACVGNRKPEFFLKRKKLSLPSRQLNGYGGEEDTGTVDVPALNKKETSV
jgi:hypothetical protein